MAEKLKMLMDIFGKVTFGVLIAAAVFISVFGGHVVSIDQMIFIMMTSIVILGILYLVIVNNCETHRNLN